MLQTSLGVVGRSAAQSLRIFAAPLRRLTDPGIGGGAMGHTWKDKETAAEATVCLTAFSDLNENITIEHER